MFFFILGIHNFDIVSINFNSIFGGFDMIFDHSNDKKVPIIHVN